MLIIRSFSSVLFFRKQCRLHLVSPTHPTGCLTQPRHQQKQVIDQEEKFEQKYHGNSEIRLLPGQDWERLHEGLLYGIQIPFVWNFENTVFQKTNMRDPPWCLCPSVVTFPTHFLARRASLPVQRTHKAFLSLVFLEAGAWSFDSVVNGTEETLDTGPLERGLLPDQKKKKKERNCASFLA